jgi:hypothetical protein
MLQMKAESPEIQPAPSPSWFAAGMPHVWLPYTQMKIAGDPLPVVAARGSRILLADGRELIDGIASWCAIYVRARVLISTAPHAELVDRA